MKKIHIKIGDSTYSISSFSGKYNWISQLGNKTMVHYLPLALFSIVAIVSIFQEPTYSQSRILHTLLVLTLLLLGSTASLIIRYRITIPEPPALLYFLLFGLCITIAVLGMPTSSTANSFGLSNYALFSVIGTAAIVFYYYIFGISYNPTLSRFFRVAMLAILFALQVVWLFTNNYSEPLLILIAMALGLTLLLDKIVEVKTFAFISLLFSGINLFSYNFENAFIERMHFMYILVSSVLVTTVAWALFYVIFKQKETLQAILSVKNIRKDDILSSRYGVIFALIGIVFVAIVGFLWISISSADTISLFSDRFEIIRIFVESNIDAGWRETLFGTGLVPENVGFGLSADALATTGFLGLVAVAILYAGIIRIAFGKVQTFSSALLTWFIVLFLVVQLFAYSSLFVLLVVILLAYAARETGAQKLVFAPRDGAPKKMFRLKLGNTTIGANKRSIATGITATIALITIVFALVVAQNFDSIFSL